MKKKTRNRLIIVAFVLALLIVGVNYTLKGNPVGSYKGVTYIKQQEEKSTKALQNTLTKIRKSEQAKQIENGKISVFDLFNDYVFYGDSRVCGFYENAFLPESRIFASVGDGVQSIPKWEKQLAALSPSNIYFLYGVNELDEIILDKGADYKEEYTKAVRKVMSSLPESHIYISSIIPVSTITSSEEMNKSYQDIPAYNRIIKSICEENGWTFVDMGDYSVGQNYYESDGVHLKKSFYTYWAQALIDATEN